MELKNYQRAVLADLRDYLTHLHKTRSLTDAYANYWADRGVTVGTTKAPAYHNLLPGVPHICYKVPTGGGKTYLACNSIAPILDSLQQTRNRVVVWLVPSEAILTQTHAALTNPDHPYRQRLNSEFGSRVEVYTKDQLLAGQNFSPTAIEDQLSILVLSYDSFRSRNKDGRKAYQANGNLTTFHTALGAPGRPIDKADPTALFQIINQLTPLVIVDESHHARSALSIDMLRDFNPSFVLDLTATPKTTSNIISYVSAHQLKSEHMVKLPVIAYNRPTQRDVIADAIELRWALDEEADKEYEITGRYIRPIVLFQAQPKNREDATSFEKLKDKLIKAGVDPDEIAIKTATINELKNIDLMSRSCRINYIITVNALKEGWDCPNAYILASLANKTSTIDVEQIVGRILRQPGAVSHTCPLLNMSYVLTASNDFNATLKNIITGLNQAGFSRKDCRVADPTPDIDTTHPTSGTPTPDPLPNSDDTFSDTGKSEADPGGGEEFLDFNENALAVDLAHRREQSHPPRETAGSDTLFSAADLTMSPQLADMMATATQQGSDYDTNTAHAADDSLFGLAPELAEMTNYTPVREHLRGDIEGLRLPRFLIEQRESLFTSGDGYKLLTPDDLTEGFTLRGQAYDLDIRSADEDMWSLDIDSDSGDQPHALKMTGDKQRYIRHHIASLPPKARRAACIDVICRHLNRIDAIETRDLRDYVTRVIDNLDSAELTTVEENPFRIATHMRQRIDSFLDIHRYRTFDRWIETGRIIVDTENETGYRLPTAIAPTDPVDHIGKSLYEAEGGMNDLETRFVSRLSSLSNIRWWHRVIERRGFALNGFITHYPDFIIRTESGKIILVETKGAHLKNDDSRRKIALGNTWTHETSSRYRYYMVFDDGVLPLDGAKQLSDALDIIADL